MGHKNYVEKHKPKMGAARPRKLKMKSDLGYKFVHEFACHPTEKSVDEAGGNCVVSVMDNNFYDPTQLRKLGHWILRAATWLEWAIQFERVLKAENQLQWQIEQWREYENAPEEKIQADHNCSRTGLRGRLKRDWLAHRRAIARYETWERTQSLQVNSAGATDAPVISKVRVVDQG